MSFKKKGDILAINMHIWRMKMHLLTVIFALLMASCTRTLYVPNQLNLPFFEQKNDYKASISSKILAPVNFDLQGAYAPLDHFALMGNASVIGLNRNENSSSFKQFFVEGGVGVFTSLWEQDNGSDLIRLELFGGYGLGNTEVTRPSSIFSSSTLPLRHVGSYHRKFLQPAIALRTRNFDFGFALRFAEINFSKYRDYSSGILTGGGSYNFTTLEPVMMFALGHNDWRVIGHFGYAVPPIASLEEYNNATGDGGWSGIHFDIGIATGIFYDRR